MIQSPVRYDLCIDEETGIVLTLKVYMKKDSGSSGEYYNQTLFESNILSFTENVSDSEFIPPIPFAFKKAVCDNDKIYVTLDSYINYDGILIAKINNNGYSSYKSVLLGAPIENVSIQANMSTINTQRLEIKTFSPFNYSVNYFQLCVGDSCVGDEECDYDRCAKYNAYGDSSMDKCMTDTECMYKDDICQKVICYDLKSKDACLNSEICAWSSRKGAEHCESKMCLEFVSQESCEKDDQCVWYNNKCEISNCLYDHSNDLLFNKTDHDNSDMFYNNTDNRKMFCEFYLSCSWDSGNNICLSNSTYEKDVIDWRK
jgi:hypothetical protein